MQCTEDMPEGLTVYVWLGWVRRIVCECVSKSVVQFEVTRSTNDIHSSCRGRTDPTTRVNERMN